MMTALGFVVLALTPLLGALLYARYRAPIDHALCETAVGPVERPRFDPGPKPGDDYAIAADGGWAASCWIASYKADLEAGWARSSSSWGLF